MTGAAAAVPAELVERVRRRLAGEPWPPAAARVAAAVRAEGGFPAGGDPLRLLRSLEDEVSGAGPLGPLLRDPCVVDLPKRHYPI